MIPEKHGYIVDCSLCNFKREADGMVKMGGQLVINLGKQAQNFGYIICQEGVLPQVFSEMHAHQFILLILFSYSFLIYAH